jgi:hypothetical protein
MADFGMIRVRRCPFAVHISREIFTNEIPTETNEMVKLLICRPRLQTPSCYHALLDTEERDQLQAEAKVDTGWQEISNSASLTPTTTTTSDDSFSDETLMESSIEGKRHLYHSSSALDTDTSNLVGVSYLSLEENFGQSVSTVWSVAPCTDCTGNTTPMIVDKEVTILTSTIVNNKLHDQGNDQKECKAAEQSSEDRVCAQSRIASDLDEFTYPRNSHEVKNTGIFWIDNQIIRPDKHEPATFGAEKSDLARLHRRNHDPSAKFAFPVDTMDNTEEKPRGRDPSIIQIADDFNYYNGADDATVSTDVSTSTDASHHSYPKRALQRESSRPDPPSASIRDCGKLSSSQASRYRENAASQSISDIPIQHNYDEGTLDETSISEEQIHVLEHSVLSTLKPFLNFPSDTFQCPPPSSSKNKHWVGIFDWLHRRRVTI